MTFPVTPLDMTVELDVGGVWTDITNDVRVRDDVVITRGRADEVGSSQPSTLTLTLNNRLGKYSPRNPLGTYYGQFGRNTQIRVTVDSVQRFIGEVSSWPAAWDKSGNDAWVTIQAAGILRRISQGSTPVSSSLKSYYLTTTPVTYWPLDDGGGTDRGQPAAGTYMGSSMHREYGHAVFEFGDGNLDLHFPPTLRINDTWPAAGLDELRGHCRGSSATPSALCYEFVYRTDPAVSLDGSNMADSWSFQAHVEGSNQASREVWVVGFQHDPGVDENIELRHVVEDGTGLAVVTNLGTTADLDAITDGQLHHVRLELTDNGADTDYELFVDGTSVLSGTRTTHTLRQSWFVTINYDRSTGEDLMAIGHVIVWENTANIPPIADTSALASGFIGEAAGRRIQRLCGEVDVPFFGLGDLDATTAMGPQFSDYFENQITEIEATDRGFIYEPRASFALGYRTRESLYGLDPLATLSFTDAQLAEPLEPVEDDAYIRNDVFAQRREGSSYQATIEEGPLSVQDPPDGVGRYKDEVQVNCETDDMLPEIAGWVLAIGTVDEPRYPQITVDFASPAIANNASLAADLLSCEIGYPILITDTSNLFIYDDIKLLVLGYTETLNQYKHRITFNCVPYSPYEVLELDDAEARVDPGEDSTLAEDMTTSETGMDVASSGFLWTTSAGDMPISIMVGGEEMTVTAISGASSPQTFTVTRGVNGVTKTHSTGAVVRLKRPGVVAF